MVNQTVQASLMLNTGEIVDMETEMAEGTETELVTSIDYSVSAVSIGQYADGKMITSVIQPISGENSISYAYLDRRGEILMILPIATSGVINQPVMPYASVQLQAGDTIRVLVKSVASRLFAYNVITAGGVHAIFTGTAASGDIALTHIKSGQGLGQSITGQLISRHFATSNDGKLIDSGGGVYVLNDRGLPVGACTATNPTKLQPTLSTEGGALINLNFVARVNCSA